MKLIYKYKSSNFDERKSNKISYIIIHYTALDNYMEAIRYLCKPSNKVSSHYLISKNGDIYNLVNEDKRAWHAGKSYWRGLKDINSSSIGIELDYNPKNSKYFNNKMIESLIKLIKKLKNKYKIKKENILGHSDIAPYRKKDPGENFPWIKLFNSELAYYPSKNYDLNDFNLEKWFKNKKILTRKRKILFMLSYIGYDISFSLNKNDYNYRRLIKVYCHHFYNNSKNKKKFLKKYDLIKVHFINQLLTF